jgi:hypothetical protein
MKKLQSQVPKNLMPNNKIRKKLIKKNKKTRVNLMNPLSGIQ